MKPLVEGTDIEGFFLSVAGARTRALILDYDGTLAPFTPDRDRAFPYPGVREALDALMDTGNSRVVIVSGRGIDDLTPLLGLKETPEIWGSHGWERLGPGGYEPPALPDMPREGLREFSRWADGAGLSDRLEQKPAGAAFHVRGIAQEEAQRITGLAAAAMEEIASAFGLEVHPFDGGLELRPPGKDKGHAVETIMGELGEGAAIIAYLGDDLTDEDAFRALGNRGLSVLVRPEPRDTSAAFWIRPPEELLWFIGRWTAACGGK